MAVDAAGFPRVTAAIDSLAASSKNVLKLHAGDAQTGTLYFNRAGANGEADAAMMNTVCFDAFTLGNHEFDKGDSGLKGFIDLLHKGSCKTPVLSANVNFGASSALAPAKAPGYVNKSITVLRDGQSIGIVGLTIADKTKASSSPDPDTTFEDETIAAQREIDALRAKGVNKIIVMSHIGYDYDKTVIAKLNGHATGLGATIALFCDVIFASSKARIGDPHVSVGFVAGDGGAVIWPQLVGYARAKEYLLTGDLLTADQAAAIGLINHSVPLEELDARVDAFADRLNAGAIKAIRWTKMATNIGLKQLAHSAMDACLAYESLSNMTRDHQEAVNAFREKRTAIFTGE